MGKKARKVVALTTSVEYSDFENPASDSHVEHGWKKVVYRKSNRKQKPADLAASDGTVSGKIVPKGNLTNSTNAFHALMFASDLEDESKKPIVTLPEAAAKIRLSHLAAFFAKPCLPEPLMFYFYLEKAFSQVSFPWVKMFKKTPLSKLIDVPLSDIPEPVYKKSVDWIKQCEFVPLRRFVSWAFERILEEQDTCDKENLEASIALLKKLVEEWKDHSLKLLSTPSDTLTLNRAIKSFRLKNEKAITEGGANCYLYKKADKSCKVISRRLSPGSGCLKGLTAITAVVLVAAGAAAGATTALVLSSQ